MYSHQFVIIALEPVRQLPQPSYHIFRPVGKAYLFALQLSGETVHFLSTWKTILIYWYVQVCTYVQCILTLLFFCVPNPRPDTRGELRRPPHTTPLSGRRVNGGLLSVRSVVALFSYCRPLCMWLINDCIAVFQLRYVIGRVGVCLWISRCFTSHESLASQRRVKHVKRTTDRREWRIVSRSRSSLLCNWLRWTHHNTVTRPMWRAGDYQHDTWEHFYQSQTVYHVYHAPIAISSRTSVYCRWQLCLCILCGGSFGWNN